MKNPNPKLYVLRIRRGKPILVDKQILRWRKRRRAQTVKPPVSPLESVIARFEPSPKGVAATDTPKALYNPFWDDTEGS